MHFSLIVYDTKKGYGFLVVSFYRAFKKWSKVVSEAFVCTTYNFTITSCIKWVYRLFITCQRVAKIWEKNSKYFAAHRFNFYFVTFYFPLIKCSLKNSKNRMLFSVSLYWSFFYLLFFFLLCRVHYSYKKWNEIPAFDNTELYIGISFIFLSKKFHK